MMVTVESYVQKGRRMVKQWMVDPRVRMGVHIAGHVLAGLLLSAASLNNRPQPLVFGLVCAAAGWQAAMLALGGALGYLLFWGQAGLQGLVWSAAALGISLGLGQKKLTVRTPLLLPAAAALATALSGLAFQLWAGDLTPLPDYLLRIVLAAGAVHTFALAALKRDPIARWVAWGFGVLALAQVAPIPWLGLGYVACAGVSILGAFPAAALTGLALDLARITPVPMTAVACMIYFVRILPGRRWVAALAPGTVYVVVMTLSGHWDLLPLPGLVLGGMAGLVSPGKTAAPHRRGHTGVAQVRLEMAAGVMVQMEQLLLETAEIPVDEAAVLARATDRACMTCPCRKGCRERDAVAAMPPGLLHRPLLDGSDLPVSCRKSGRLLAELHRAQEQLRTIRADRERQREYRTAVVQQYRFLAEFIRDLSDRLGSRAETARQRFQPQVSVYANRKWEDNGDRISHFPGTGGKYYVLLCDGMGSGMGAVDEGETAVSMAKKLLCAGFPAEYVLRTVNSLCALRGKAGAVTVDLAELLLDSGKAVLYKWGAAPSCLVTAYGAEKIGTAVPPPGLSVNNRPEAVERLSLGRGETLFLLSDGVEGEVALRCCQAFSTSQPGELAAKILEEGGGRGDDATVAVIRLSSVK